MALIDAIKLARMKAAKRPNCVVSVYDNNGVCRYVSTNVLELTGTTPEELVGTNYAAFTPKRDVATTLLAREDTRLFGESVEVKVDAIQKNGDVVTWKVMGWSVPGDDEYVITCARKA